MRIVNWRYFALSALLIFSGCISKTDQETIPVLETNNGKPFANEEIGYTVYVPKILGRWTTFSRSLEATESYPTFTTEEGNMDQVRMTIYPAPSCTSSSVYEEDKKIIEIGNMTAEWGKIGSDLKSGYGILTDDMYCRYSNLNCSSEEFWTGGCEDDTAVYGFCAENKGSPLTEKDDKRVVICISQQTDNKKQAEEIFKSFRWTE